MTDTPTGTAPEAITQARMAEMLALAPLQSVEPPKDRVFYARQHVPMKWTPYKPTSQEVKRGKKGRWQQLRTYGLGWENADVEPKAGAWIEDVINHPNRRLTSLSAGQGLREGWRLVPVEADDAMATAAAAELQRQTAYLGWEPTAIWSAMLGAAPVPPSSSPAIVKEAGEDWCLCCCRKREEHVRGQCPETTYFTSALSASNAAQVSK